MNGGRPVIILRAKNLVAEHDKPVRVSYTFARKRMVVEPLMLVLSYFLFFCLCSLIARTGSSIKGAKAARKEAAATTVTGGGASSGSLESSSSE